MWLCTPGFTVTNLYILETEMTPNSTKKNERSHSALRPAKKYF